LRPPSSSSENRRQSWPRRLPHPSSNLAARLLRSLPIRHHSASGVRPLELAPLRQPPPLRQQLHLRLPHCSAALLPRPPLRSPSTPHRRCSVLSSPHHLRNRHRCSAPASRNRRRPSRSEHPPPVLRRRSCSSPLPPLRRSPLVRRRRARLLLLESSLCRL